MHWRRAARRGGKWACTGVAAACLVGFGVSFHRWVGWRETSDRVEAWIANGVITGWWYKQGFGSQRWPAGFDIGPPSFDAGRVRWLPELYNAPTYRGVVIPVWIPFLLTSIPAAWLWRSDRRAARLAACGGCGDCGYDRSGLPPTAPCPECGRVPPKE